MADRLTQPYVVVPLEQMRIPQERIYRHWWFGQTGVDPDMPPEEDHVVDFEVKLR